MSGSNANVSVQIAQTAIPSSLQSPTTDDSSDGASGSADNSAQSSSSSDTLPADWRFASAQAMTADESEPLASSDSAEDAFAEDDDWVLDSLLT